MGGGGGTARVRRAVDQQLAAQRAMGHLEVVDQGLVGLARTLADTIDAEVLQVDPNRYTIGALAGRLLPVLLELRGERRDAGSGIGWDEELESLKAELRREAALRHAEGPGPSDTRA